MAPLRARVDETSAYARRAMVAVGVAGAWNVVELIVPQASTLLAHPTLGLAEAALSIVVHVTAMVLYCQWLYRAHQDCARLGGPEVVRPAAAVQAFFIPVYNFFMPYRILRDLHAASDPRALPDPPEYTAATGTQYRSAGLERVVRPEYDLWFPVRAWWATYIVIPVVLALGATVMAWISPMPTGVVTDIVAGTAYGALRASAAVLAICVVRSIASRQQEWLRRLEAVAEADPAVAVVAGREAPVRIAKGAGADGPGQRVAAEERAADEEAEVGAAEGRASRMRHPGT